MGEAQSRKGGMGWAPESRSAHFSTPPRDGLDGGVLIAAVDGHRRELAQHREQLGLPAHHRVRGQVGRRHAGQAPDRGGHVVGAQAHAQGLRGLHLVHVLRDHDRVDEQGQHVDHADAVAGPFDVEGLGQAAHRGLGRRVTREHGLTIQRRGRAHVDHPRTRRAQQIRQGRVAAIEHALEVDVDQAVVARQLGLFEQRCHGHTRVVEEQVEALACRRTEGAERGLPVGRVGHVQAACDGAAGTVARGQQGGQGLHRGQVHVEQADEPAFGGKAFGHGPADAGGRTGDEDG
jgi:hypothetical protein